MTLQSARLTLTLTVVALYFLLDGTFMLLRVPPGSASGVPTGELLIALFLLTLAADTHLLTPFFRTVPTAPFLVWWFVGSVQLGYGLAKYGMIAARDATSLIESMFLWIGFVVAATPGAMSRILSWSKWVVILSVLITLTYPFREAITAVSPVILSTHMIPVALFFGYHVPPMTTFAAAAHLAVTDRRYWGVKSTWVAAALIIFVVALLQQRTIYLQALFLFGYLALARRGNPLRLAAPLVTAVALFFSLIALGVPIPGRISQNVSLDFYIEHFLAIGGQGNTTGTENRDVVGAASGVGQRLFWWRVIWDQVTSTWTNMMFGLGYGVSLVGLARDPGISGDVREPHNSLMSALGRTGFVGLGSYVWLHIALTLTGVRTYLAYRTKGYDEIAQWIFVAGLMFGFYWIGAMGEDAFEKPFISITYYFLYGVILNLCCRDAHLPSRAYSKKHAAVAVRLRQ